ncbi:MAG TPA: alpha/beta hydrolase [Bellilinea sp.]|nr:alpha/beta hydrolase [Bellilinea sp.]
MPFFKTFYYLLSQKGSGRSLPVILLHGEGMNCHYWPKEIRCLSGFDTYALDLPGHGGDNGTALQSVEKIADVVFDFMLGMNLLNAAVIGHSLGGAVALTLALWHPLQVAGAGMIGGATSFSLPSALLDYMASPATFYAGQQLYLDKLTCAFTKRETRTFAVSLLQQTRPTAFHADLMAMDTFDIAAELNDLHCPVYVVSGKEDHLVSPVNSRTAAADLPIARLELLDRCGHLLPLERPDALMEGLHGYLTDLQTWYQREELQLAFPRSLRAGVYARNRTN